MGPPSHPTPSRKVVLACLGVNVWRRMPVFSTPRHYLLLAWLTPDPSSVGLGWAGKLTWDLIPLLLWLF